MARAPFFRPGWVVTSLTRSPASQTSRSCSRNPLRYCRPVRAGIAPHSLAVGQRESTAWPGGRPASPSPPSPRTGWVRARASGRGSDGIDMRRIGDVLQPLLAEIYELGRDRSPHMTPGVGRDADAAGRGETFEACRDIDAVAIDVVRRHDDVAEIDADAELDAEVL